MTDDTSSTAGTSPATNPVTNQVTKKSYTPPKGRPTRSRRGGPYRGRVLGPVTQWVALVAAVIVIVAIVIVVTNGGDFNPLNDDPTFNTGSVIVDAS